MFFQCWLVTNINFHLPEHFQNIVCLRVTKVIFVFILLILEEGAGRRGGRQTAPSFSGIACLYPWQDFLHVCQGTNQKHIW